MLFQEKFQEKLKNVSEVLNELKNIINDTNEESVEYTKSKIIEYLDDKDKYILEYIMLINVTTIGFINVVLEEYKININVQGVTKLAIMNFVCNVIRDLIEERESLEG